MIINLGIVEVFKFFRDWDFKAFDKNHLNNWENSIDKTTIGHSDRFLAQFENLFDFN